jgi:membrane-associated phospholipid phosphatase
MAKLRAVRVQAIGVLVGLALAASRADAASEGDSIYQVHPVVDGAVIAASSATIITLYALGKEILDVHCPCDPKDVNSIDRHAIGNDSDIASRAGDIMVGLSLVTPVVLDWLALRQVGPYLEDLTIFAETLAVSGAFLTIAKHATSRPFPRTYAGDPDLVGHAGGYRSFYSGHTTLTFAALSASSFTIGRRYGIHFLPWLTTVVIGSSVGVAMVASGWHFPSDVAVGAVAGTTVGVAIPVLHLRQVQLQPLISAFPQSGPVGGLAVAGRWR